jgi:predicted RNA-binding Zn-ribbon protein involved in translation (DUF1610 family)
MNIFISHNKKQKSLARLLAMALVENGENVWFDEWQLAPGESLVGGIEKGLGGANVFALIWSKEAAKSNWVGTELRAYLRRRVDDESLRVIPIMVDDTPLPILVADYLGFEVKSPRSIGKVAARICGSLPVARVIRRLQERLRELTVDSDATNDPLPYKRCPDCGENSFDRRSTTDNWRDEIYYVISCKKCGWIEWTQ